MNIIEEYKNCLYYPAGGTDIQVLLRFSDLIDTVLSPTLSNYLTIEKYDELFSAKCKDINDNYGTDVLRYVGYDILDNSFVNNKRLLAFPPIFSKNEINLYMESFSSFIRKEIFVVNFKFERIVGNEIRKMNWVAMNTEGLATMVSMNKLANADPRILCTIQSGVLEYSESLFVRLLNSRNVTSKIWIRGFWPCTVWGDEPITEFPPYNISIQDYPSWYSRMGVLPEPNEENTCPLPISKVRAFTNQQLFLDNLNTDTKTYVHKNNESRKLRLIYGSINDYASEYDAVILYRQMAVGRNPDRILWASLSEKTNRLYPLLTFTESLYKAEELIIEKGYKKIAMVPIGFEDESSSIEKFINEKEDDIEIDIYYNRLLDFLSERVENLQDVL